MTDSNERSQEARDAVRHLEAALDADEMSEADYHVRQALQLLDVE